MIVLIQGTAFGLGRFGGVIGFDWRFGGFGFLSRNTFFPTALL